MSDQSLRSGLIRLAYANPSLRPTLLPLITKHAGEMDAELEEDADPTSHDQNKPESYYGLAPKGKQASVKMPSGSGATNAAYLRQSPLKDKILRTVAKQYGVSVSEIEGELTDPDAAALYEYIGSDRALQLQVRREFLYAGL